MWLPSGRRFVVAGSIVDNLGEELRGVGKTDNGSAEAENVHYREAQSAATQSVG